MTTQIETTDVLNDIFLKPSNETKTNRFSDSQAASCSGECTSGMCRTISE